MAPVNELASISISLATVANTRAAFGVGLIAGDSDKLPEKSIVVMTFDASLVASNSIAGDVDGTPITPVVWNATHDGTIADLLTELLLASGIGAAVASDVGAVGYNNTVTITSTNIDTILTLASFVVTLGASQPTITLVTTPFARTRSYTSLATVAVDFAVTDPEYLAARDFFGQDPNPGTVKIGRIENGNDWSDELTLVNAVDPAWTAFVITDRTIVDQTDVAAWAKTNEKIFLIGSADADILNSGVSSDIASVIATAVNDFAAAIYHTTAGTNWPDASWMADGLSRDPGSQTWSLKTLTLFAADVLTVAQRAAALAKGANVYEAYADRIVTRDGTLGGASVTGAEFIDVTRGKQWLQSDQATRLVNLLADSPKVPYTDAGLAQLESEIRASLDGAIDVGFLRADPDSYDGQPYRITTAKVNDIAAGERAARNVPATALAWQAALGGAIHSVEISGVIAI